MLYFWAIWCAPCRERIPGLADLCNPHRKDLAVIGIEVGYRENRVACS
ncbi:MAG: redoxin domain-containing protein [Burkholderiales bacterium]|nr:redoxin domain-containing protein [Burkholderiales bacterium]